MERGHRFRKCLPVLLMIWPYILWTLKDLEHETVVSVIVILYLILTAVLYVINIINACTYPEECAAYELALFDMLIKFIHIPFYLFVFLIGVIFLFASVVPALLFVTPIVIFHLFIIDVLMMLTSSMYGINAILRARKSGVVTNKFTVIHCVMHCFFVMDVISAVVVFMKLRKSRR